MKIHAVFILIGEVLILTGAIMSSSIWARIQALPWPVAKATITNIEWRGDENFNAASAVITFVVDERATTYKDRVFNRPLLKRNVPKAEAEMESVYRVGSTIDVRWDGSRALLVGFPESYAKLGLLQMLGGLGFALGGVGRLYGRC